MPCASIILCGKKPDPATIAALHQEMATIIERDLEATKALAEAISIPVIASGGITDIEDIRALCALQASGVMGAITGRAIYAGTLDFAAGQRLADQC